MWGVAWGVESFPVVSVVVAELFGSVVQLCLEVRYVRSVDDVLWKQVVDEDESEKLACRKFGVGPVAAFK